MKYQIQIQNTHLDLTCLETVAAVTTCGRFAVRFHMCKRTRLSLTRSKDRMGIHGGAKLSFSNSCFVSQIFMSFFCKCRWAVRSHVFSVTSSGGVVQGSSLPGRHACRRASDASQSSGEGQHGTSQIKFEANLCSLGMSLWYALFFCHLSVTLLQSDWKNESCSRSHSFLGHRSNGLLVSNAQVYFMERAKAAGVKEQKEEEEEKLQSRWFESFVISQRGDRKIVRSFYVLFDCCVKRAVGSGRNWNIQNWNSTWIGDFAVEDDDDPEILALLGEGTDAPEGGKTFFWTREVSTEASNLKPGGGWVQEYPRVLQNNAFHSFLCITFHLLPFSIVQWFTIPVTVFSHVIFSWKYPSFVQFFGYPFFFLSRRGG